MTMGISACILQRPGMPINFAINKKKRHCSDYVKVKLFKSYCSSFYCYYLWAKSYYKFRSKLVVVYKHIFRSFFHCRRLDTTSHMINFTTDSYYVILQKLPWNFNTRLNFSDNAIVATIVNALYIRFTNI